MFVRITYSNGYCGCDNEEVLEVENMEEANTYAQDALHDYAETYEYVACGWDRDFETEEEKDAYYEDCSYSIEEITEEQYQEEM